MAYYGSRKSEKIERTLANIEYYPSTENSEENIERFAKTVGTALESGASLGDVILSMRCFAIRKPDETFISSAAKAISVMDRNESPWISDELISGMIKTSDEANYKPEEEEQLRTQSIARQLFVEATSPMRYPTTTRAHHSAGKKNTHAASSLHRMERETGKTTAELLGFDPHEI